MRSLSARELLDVWEVGASQPLVQRSLLLLSAAYVEMSYDALAQLPIGQRDVRLLTLREWLFGSQLSSIATCPNCGERLQLTLSIHDLQIEASETPEPISLLVDGYTVRYRLPNSTDLLAVIDCATVAASRERLLQRCVQSVDTDGGARPIDSLPANVVETISAHMAQADPQADMQLDLKCSACGQRWLAPLDIAVFLWSEIEAWARRILREVHMLASTYGWSESDILAMSVTRRQLYLDLIGCA